MKEAPDDPRPRARADPRVSERPGRDRLSRAGTGDRVPDVRVPLPGPRRHPRDVDRRGGEALTSARVDLDDDAAIAALDSGDMLGTVAALDAHIEAGYAAGLATTGLPSLDGVTSVVFCGMGGSAVAGDILRQTFRDRLPVPVD